MSAHRGRMCRGIVDASSLRLVVPGRIKRELPQQLTVLGHHGAAASRVKRLNPARHNDDNPEQTNPTDGNSPPPRPDRRATGGLGSISQQFDGVAKTALLGAGAAAARQTIPRQLSRGWPSLPMRSYVPG